MIRLMLDFYLWGQDDFQISTDEILSFGCWCDFESGKAHHGSPQVILNYIKICLNKNFFKNHNNFYIKGNS